MLHINPHTDFILIRIQILKTLDVDNIKGFVYNKDS